MSQQRRTPPLDQLRKALPQLPDRLRAAARFVVEHEYDAATRSMRDLASEAGLQPTSFTRLAQALGHSGWEEFRVQLVDASRPEPSGPFTRRRAALKPGSSPEEAVVVEALGTDASGLGRIDAAAVARAAALLHGAPRIWIAGFRSCRSLALLLHYQLRLFRPDDVLLVGGTDTEECDFGSFRESDVVVLFGFQPYSQAGVQTRIAAVNAKARLIAVADEPHAAICEGADEVLLFESATTPAFFPSLTGAVAVTQGLAAALYLLGGEQATAQLRQAETRLAAMARYVPDKESP